MKRSIVVLFVPRFDTFGAAKLPFSIPTFEGEACDTETVKAATNQAMQPHFLLPDLPYVKERIQCDEMTWE